MADVAGEDAKGYNPTNSAWLTLYGRRFDEKRSFIRRTYLYELLMRHYNQRLFRLIRSVILDEIEAEDVLQHVWVRTYEHLAQLEGPASVATWVTRIALYESFANAPQRKAPHDPRGR